MTRIVRLHDFGGPEVLKIDEVETPEPGPGEVRLRVGAIGLNRVEAIYRAGGFGPVPLPAKIGYEAAGVIEALGPGAAGVSVGDAVAVLPGVLMPVHGTYGEQILVPADHLVKSPPGQPVEEAAATWMQYLTAYALLQVPVIRLGDPVVLTAASSSVGLAAIQIVNRAGGVPIAVTRGRAKAEALKAHGAAHVIASDAEDLAPAVRALTGGAGATVAFDAVAGERFAELTAAMAPKGTIILYGALAGDVAAFPVNPFMMAGLTVRGYAANLLVDDPEARATALDYVRSGLADGALKPSIDRVFAFDDMVEAHRYLESNAQTGKIVVKVE